MLIRLWDFLFTRRVWEVIGKVNIYEKEDSKLPYETKYIMKDQFGNIKKKKV